MKLIYPRHAPPTDGTFSPWDQLPAPPPKDTTYLPRHFYEYTAKHLVKDTVRIMYNGLHVDIDQVIALEGTLEAVLEEVGNNLGKNPLIQKYLKQRYAMLVSTEVAARKAKLVSYEKYLTDFNSKNATHRSYFMHVFAKSAGIKGPNKASEAKVEVWPVKLIRKLSATKPLLRRLLAGEIASTHPTAVEAMKLLATHKAELRNKVHEERIANPKVDLPVFNPGSSKQKSELFAMLDIPCEKSSKTTGGASWDRAEVERVNKETLDEDVKDFTQQFIDYSYAAIVRNNFINAFYSYTVDNRLYGTYKLLGAKSGRYTSSNPNMLNKPSSGSIFAKPIKKCFTAAEGFIIATIDYAALEDRVVANLSGDTNKLAVFLEGIDG